MEKIINFFEKNVKLILGTIFVVCILNCIICICKDIKLLEALLGFGISIGLFFVAWGMIFVVLCLQFHYNNWCHWCSLWNTTRYNSLFNKR